MVGSKSIGTMLPTGASKQDVVANWQKMTATSTGLALVGGFRFQRIDMLLSGPDALWRVNQALAKHRFACAQFTQAQIDAVRGTLSSAIDNACAAQRLECDGPLADRPLPPPATVNAVPDGAFYGSLTGPAFSAFDGLRVAQLFGRSSLTYDIRPAPSRSSPGSKEVQRGGTNGTLRPPWCSRCSATLPGRGARRRCAAPGCKSTGPGSLTLCALNNVTLTGKAVDVNGIDLLAALRQQAAELQALKQQFADLQGTLDKQCGPARSGGSILTGCRSVVAGPPQQPDRVPLIIGGAVGRRAPPRAHDPHRHALEDATRCRRRASGDIGSVLFESLRPV